MLAGDGRKTLPSKPVPQLGDREAISVIHITLIAAYATEHGTEALNVGYDCSG